MGVLLTPKVESFEMVLDDFAKDKSISHRSVIFSFLCDGVCKIKGFLDSQDSGATLQIARDLGCEVEFKDGVLNLKNNGVYSPSNVLNCQNSGTSMRLYCGLLSGLCGDFVLSGDDSLNSRPMQRVVDPLRQMGANISTNDGYAPISIKGASLSGASYESQFSSAQVKSAFILAGLNASGKSAFFESLPSRDHSENMLSYFGAKVVNIANNGGILTTIEPLESRLDAFEIEIANDPSSAFFFAVACGISPNSRILLKNVLLNRYRIEAFLVLERMGVKISFLNKKNTYEQIGDILVESSGALRGVVVDKNISSLIDEIPALSIAMALADGVSEVRNARELRIKESDRISSIVSNLRALGIEALEREDGFVVNGGRFCSGEVKSFGDHRIAMSFALAGIKKDIKIDCVECVGVSFPEFFSFFSKIVNIRSV